MELKIILINSAMFILGAIKTNRRLIEKKGACLRVINDAVGSFYVNVYC
jgi:hypothetical protein